MFRWYDMKTIDIRYIVVEINRNVSKDIYVKYALKRFRKIKL